MNRLTNINYKFIASGAMMSLKGAIHRLIPTVENTTVKIERLSSSGSGIGVVPGDYQGKFFEVSLSLGKTQSADEMKMEEAICSISRAKHIVKTQLTGLDGTIKEYINNGDYDINISVGLVAIEDGVITDQYPADGIRAIKELLDHNEPLFVNSEFLQLFDITKIVITDYAIQQMTHSNRQVISIKALSDEDYELTGIEY